MKYIKLLAIFSAFILVLGGAYLIAGEKTEKPEKNKPDEQPLARTKVEVKSETKAGATKDVKDKVKISEKGKVEIWVNGKKVVDKSYESDGSDKGKNREEFEKALKKFMKDWDLKFEDEKAEKEDKSILNDFDFSITTEKGKHYVRYNGRKIEVNEKDDGSLDINVKIDKDGKATLVINGKDYKVDETLSVRSFHRVFPRGSRPKVKSYFRAFPRFDSKDFKRFRRGFDFEDDDFNFHFKFDFDGEPLKELERFMKRFRSDQDDGFGRIRKEMERLLKEFGDDGFDAPRPRTWKNPMPQKRRIVPDEEEYEHHEKREQRLVPKGEGEKKEGVLY